MKSRFSKILLGLGLAFSTLIFAACSNGADSVESEEKVEVVENGEVNLYTNRHYDTDEKLLSEFTEETGIKVNVIKGGSDELIERLEREGEDTQADLLITADAGRLYRAKEKGLLKEVQSPVLEKNIPENLRDTDKEWFALTMRARIIAYSKDRVDAGQLSTYEDLSNEKWNDKILVRSSSNIYNQSLLASFIAIHGEDRAKEMAAGIVENMAREPKGNDRDQAKAIVAGEGDIAIMNTYYVGKLLNSSDSEEVKVGEQIGVFFPDQKTTGAHINVSGIGLTRHSKNSENAVKLMEFLSQEKAQSMFAQANYEYPVNPEVEPSELLKSWGEFKAQDINLSLLGEYNKRAVEIANEIGWK